MSGIKFFSLWPLPLIIDWNSLSVMSCLLVDSGNILDLARLVHWAVQDELFSILFFVQPLDQSSERDEGRPLW